MTPGQRLKVAGATLAFTGIVLTGMFLTSPRGRANDRDDDDDRDPRIEQGFDIAPVHLDLEGKNRKLVGLGSYLVNTGGCNDCHDTGPRDQFAQGGNPYFLGHHDKQLNTATYLGGGRVFLPISGPPSPPIISRNLTPDKTTGLPEGGNTFEQFLDIFRHGTDFDHLHPNCDASIGITTNCFPHSPQLPPFDGDLLQVMPWPNLKDLTDHDIRAIYEYLKAIPCIRGNYPGPSGLAAGIPPESADRCGE